jgi:hypothetical protein
LKKTIIFLKFKRGKKKMKKMKKILGGVLLSALALDVHQCCYSLDVVGIQNDANETVLRDSFARGFKMALAFFISNPEESLNLDLNKFNNVLREIESGSRGPQLNEIIHQQGDSEKILLRLNHMDEPRNLEEFIDFLLKIIHERDCFKRDKLGEGFYCSPTITKFLVHKIEERVKFLLAMAPLANADADTELRLNGKIARLEQTVMFLIYGLAMCHNAREQVMKSLFVMEMWLGER